MDPKSLNQHSKCDPTMEILLSSEVGIQISPLSCTVGDLLRVVFCPVGKSELYAIEPTDQTADSLSTSVDQFAMNFPKGRFSVDSKQLAEHLFVFGVGHSRPHLLHKRRVAVGSDHFVLCE